MERTHVRCYSDESTLASLFQRSGLNCWTQPERRSDGQQSEYWLQGRNSVFSFCAQEHPECTGISDPKSRRRFPALRVVHQKQRAGQLQSERQSLRLAGLKIEWQR